MAAISAKYAVADVAPEAEVVEKEMTLEEIEVVLYGSVAAANVAASKAAATMPTGLRYADRVDWLAKRRTKAHAATDEA